MGSWAENPTTRAWTLTGTSVRSVVVASAPFPGKSAVKLDLVNYAHEVRAVLLASKDGRSCYEVGVVGANVVIQKISFGGAPGVVNNSASDTPPSTPCSVPHGLAAGVPFSLQARLVDGVIECWINGDLVLSHAVDPASYVTVRVPFARQSYYGFVSSVSGAVIQAAQICSLKAAEPGTMTEVLIAVCDGDVWLSEDALTFQKIGTGSFRPTGYVSLTEFNLHVYGVDGVYARDINPVTAGVIPWTASSGAFPASDGPGLTRMTMVETFLGRVVMGGDPQDPQNAWMCEINNANGWNTAARSIGRAFATGLSLPGKIGQPITCLKQVARGVLVIGCAGQVWRLIGDPGAGTPELTPALLGSGISGQEACALATDSVGVFHSPDGVFVIGAAGDPIGLSELVLTEGIQIPRSQIGEYLVQVRRDTRHHLTHIFLTKAATGASLHYVFDERIGKVMARGGAGPAGGFFPDEYADRIGPTASCTFRGELLIGGRDGYVYRFDHGRLDSLDDGEAFTSRMPMGHLAAESIADDVALRSFQLELDDQSDSVEIRVYGGRTVQEAISGSGRALHWSRRIGPRQSARHERSSAAAIAVELWNADGTKAWQTEAAEVEYETKHRRARQGRITPAAPPPPCEQPARAGGGTTDPDPGPGNEDEVLIEYYMHAQPRAGDTAFDKSVYESIQPPRGPGGGTSPGGGGCGSSDGGSGGGANYAVAVGVSVCGSVSGGGTGAPA